MREPSVGKSAAGTPPSSLRAVRKWVPYAVLVGAVLFTAASTYTVSHMAEAKDRLRFQNAVQEAQERVQLRLETYIALLRATNGVFATDPAITRDEFQVYVDRLELDHRYPGIQGIGFSLRVKASDKNRFVLTMRKHGAEGFRIWPDGDREEYHSIIFIEPLDRRNRAAMGYDMFTEPVRRVAMEKARD